MPFVKMRTRRVEYDIEIHGKYTLIRGDSATGKTTLYHLAELAAINSPAVTLESDKQIKVVQRDASDTDFERRKDCIYIIDESCTLLRIQILLQPLKILITTLSLFTEWINLAIFLWVLIIFVDFRSKQLMVFTNILWFQCSRGLYCLQL